MKATWHRLESRWLCSHLIHNCQRWSLLRLKTIIVVTKSSQYVLLYLCLKSLCDHVKIKWKQILPKRSSAIKIVTISQCWTLTMLSWWKEWTTIGPGKTFWTAELSNKLPTSGINSWTWPPDKTWIFVAHQRLTQITPTTSRSAYCLGSTCKLQV